MSIGIVGMGYVGLPLAVAFAEAGENVVAVDVDPKKIRDLAAGHSYIEDISTERLQTVAAHITPTRNFALLAQAEAVVICVPTPLTSNREPDLGPLLAASHSVAEYAQPGQLIVLESTTYPGTTRERLVPLLQERDLTPGDNVFVAFSPERVDPGRTDYTLKNTPKVLGGITPACRERACDLYSKICDELVPVSSPETAEMSKLLENIFRSVNIALVNEMSILADRMGIDIWEVVDAAKTKPYGFMSFEPGPGMGGHCLPVDPFYLAWKAREYDFVTEFIEVAGKVNQSMPYVCVERIERRLNDASRPVRGAKIAIIGASYKPGVGDLRESPALKIMKLLAGKGAELSYHDPHVPELERFGLHSRPLAELVDEADLVVIVTAHPKVDHTALAEQARLVLDLRGVTRDAVIPRAARL